MKKNILLLLLIIFIFPVVSGCDSSGGVNTDNKNPGKLVNECSDRSVEWFKIFIGSDNDKKRYNNYVNHYFADSGNCYVVVHYFNSPFEYYDIYNPYENNEIAHCPVVDLIYNKRVSPFKCINMSTSSTASSPEVNYLMDNYMTK